MNEGARAVYVKCKNKVKKVIQRQCTKKQKRAIKDGGNENGRIDQTLLLVHSENNGQF